MAVPVLGVVKHFVAIKDVLTSIPFPKESANMTFGTYFCLGQFLKLARARVCKE
jgi:hypothetical protein